MDHSFLHSKKLLLVDDEPELLKMVTAILADEGFQRLVTAANMKEGITSAKEEKPDLAILDKLAGLGLGADDYIPKPFLPQEFLLRVYAVLRRCYKEDAAVLKLDSCTVDFSRAEVDKDGEILPLTAMEHRLLETLARNEGRIVTVDTLCEALWGDNPFGYENSLNAHVRRVREKIEADPSKPVSLLTVKGLGYKLLARK